MNPRTLILGAFAALVLLTAANATPVFNPEETGIIASTSAAPMAFSGSFPNLRMYYIVTGASQTVLSALSSDGINFTPDPITVGNLSTATTPSVSAAAISGGAILPIAGGYRMEYSIISTTGSYRVHSATSADGLNWANDPGTRIDARTTYLASPTLVKLTDNSWRMFFVENAGSTSIFTSRSTDLGLTWTPPAQALAASALDVGASELTDGRVRLFYTVPVGASSGTTIASALSTDVNATSFNVETGIRISTLSAAGTISTPVAIRSTDTFRWRLYYDFSPAAGGPKIYSALTGAPAPTGSNPSYILNTTSTAAFTISGEIFSTPAPTVSLSQAGQLAIPGTGVTLNSDESIAANFNVFAANPGPWDLIVTNADGTSTTLPRAVTIDFPGGSVSLVNNLLRPRTGTVTTITISFFNPGHVLSRLYTLDGRYVSTLLDTQRGAGTVTITWDGRDSSGAAVASGVYILHTVGPKIDLKSKIIVVR